MLASVPRLTREAAEVTAEAAASATSDVESQGPSLPLSILDVRSKALEEIQNKPAKVQSRTEPKKPSQVSKLVSDQLDKGPFFGLPTKVKELYVEQKKVTSLFAWQERCLKSLAVKNKSNFLYSLPNSGGKTLVAEINNATGVALLQEERHLHSPVCINRPRKDKVADRICSGTRFLC